MHDCLDSPTWGDKEFSVIATNQIPHLRNEMETGPLSFVKKSGTALGTGNPEVFAKGNSAQFPAVSKEANAKQRSIERRSHYVTLPW